MRIIRVRPRDATVRDCKGVVAVPGLVDARVFVGEPGAEHRETIESAARAAAAGGVTSIIVMPDTDPSSTTLRWSNMSEGGA